MLSKNDAGGFSYVDTHVLTADQPSVHNINIFL